MGNNMISFLRNMMTPRPSTLQAQISQILTTNMIFTQMLEQQGTVVELFRTQFRPMTGSP
jgi:hypothetical protein